MPATQTRKRTTRTVLLRMAADHERAERIRELKESAPGLTWQAIADHVGVSMRAAQAWAENGEIARTNAERLAELFPDADVDYIMRGPQAVAPDLMAVLGQPDLRDQLDRIEGMLRELLERGFQQELEQAAEPDGSSRSGSAADASES